MAASGFKFSSVTGARRIALTAMLVLGLTSPQLQANIEQQRQLFRDASSALERNQLSKFSRLLEQLDGYPASPYLEYDRFKRLVFRAKSASVEQFLERYKDYPFAYHARGKWLKVLARRGGLEKLPEIFR